MPTKKTIPTATFANATNNTVANDLVAAVANGAFDTNVKTDIKNVKVGTRLSRVSYLEVLSVDTNRFTGRTDVNVRNENGMQWTMTSDILENETYSADQFTETVKVSRTELINVLENAGDAIFTAAFNKQPKLEDVLASTRKANGRIMSQDELKKAITAAMKGEERVLIGYLLEVEPKMGRSQVIDLEVSRDKHRIRQVDHRTINWIILKNKKYVVKK